MRFTLHLLCVCDIDNTERLERRRSSQGPGVHRTMLCEYFVSWTFVSQRRLDGMGAIHGVKAESPMTSTEAEISHTVDIAYHGLNAVFLWEPMTNEYVLFCTMA